MARRLWLGLGRMLELRLGRFRLGLGMAWALLGIWLGLPQLGLGLG